MCACAVEMLKVSWESQPDKPGLLCLERSQHRRPSMQMFPGPWAGAVGPCPALTAVGHTLGSSCTGLAGSPELRGRVFPAHPIFSLAKALGVDPALFFFVMLYFIQKFTCVLNRFFCLFWFCFLLCSRGWPQSLGLLTQHPEHWDYRHVPPCLAFFLGYQGLNS